MAKKPKPTDERPAKTAGSATKWLERIDARIAAEDTWRKQGSKVVQRYRDERAKAELANSSRINILWANTEVLKSALYARTAKPDVRRRFPDAKKGNSASRVAAEVLERATMFVLDTEDVDGALIPAVEDMLLPGRGVVWVSYEPEIEEPEEDDSEDEAESASGTVDARGGGLGPATGLGASSSYAASGETASANGRLVAQKLCLEYVYWEDYVEGKARQDKHVPWKARRHALDEDTFEVKFPDAKDSKLRIPGSGGGYKLKDASGQNESQDDDDFVEVWEIWASAGKKRIWVARGYADVLQEDEDPYELSTFFPVPKPLRSVTTTDTQTPRAEFLQYQDQANQLDRCSTRIDRLMAEIKWRGIYDATLPDGASPGGSTLADMSKADDGEFLPHSNYQAIRDRGGIGAAFGFMPIEIISAVVDKLSIRQAQLVQEIYDITGISDIVRGSTDPNETKGAQTLKAQFGNMRMQTRQREVQRFIRDAYRIIAEIIAEHFTQETLAEITGMDLPTKQEQLQLKQKIAMLQQPSMAASAAPPTTQPPSMGMGGPSAPGSMGGPGGPTAGPGAPPAMQGQQPMPGGPPPPDQASAAPDVPSELIERSLSPTWDEVMQILRSDKLRGYRVDVETDSTMQDEDAEKQRRVEAIGAMNDMLEKAYVAATQAPKTLPLIKEMFLFGMRTFKAARSLEETVEDAFLELEQNPPQPPQGPASTDIPPDMKAMEMQKKLQILEATQQADAAHKAQSLQIDQAHKQGSLEIENKRADTEAAHKQEMAAIEAAKLSHVKQAHVDTMGMEAAKLEQAKQTQAETMAHTKATSAADMNLKQATHNKALVEENAAAPAGDGTSNTSVLDTIMQALTQVVQTVTAGNQQVANTIAAGQRQIAQEQASQAQQTAQLIQLIAAPKRVIRGQDGKAVGVETVTH